MKRYTKRQDDGQAVMDCQNCQVSWMNKPNTDCSALYCRNRLKELLAAYEDTGLEPKEINRIVDAYGRGHTLRTYDAERLEIIKDIPTERLRELVEADRDGRCVVVTRCCECKNHSDVDGKHYCKFWRMYCPDDSEFYCKAAESALKGEQDGNKYVI